MWHKAPAATGSGVPHFYEIYPSMVQLVDTALLWKGVALVRVQLDGPECRRSESRRGGEVPKILVRAIAGELLLGLKAPYDI